MNRYFIARVLHGSKNNVNAWMVHRHTAAGYQRASRYLTLTAAVLECNRLNARKEAQS